LLAGHTVRRKRHCPSRQYLGPAARAPVPGSPAQQTALQGRDRQRGPHVPDPDDHLDRWDVLGSGYPQMTRRRFKPCLILRKYPPRRCPCGSVEGCRESRCGGVRRCAHAWAPLSSGVGSSWIRQDGTRVVCPVFWANLQLRTVTVLGSNPLSSTNKMSSGMEVQVPRSAAVNAQGLGKRFGRQVAVAGLTVDFPAGSCSELGGPNGVSSVRWVARGKSGISSLPPAAGESRSHCGAARRANRAKEPGRGAAYSRRPSRRRR